MNLNKYIYIIMILLTYSPTFSQGSAGEKAIYETRFIVDMPTAGVLEKGNFAIYTNAFYPGGIMLQLDASPFSDFLMGISYSGTNIIGFGAVNWQGIPGVHLRYRIIDETLNLPAFVLGINTQGRGDFSSSEKRFQTFSPGVFISASKNYSWALGSVAFHGGINYSFEPSKNENFPNLYLGIEHSIGKSFALNFEFNATLNDENKKYMSNKGLINASLRWSLAKGITLDFQARDLLENMTMNKAFNRAVCLEYISRF
ncbi:hypothetical protein D9V86_03315 [Bacteroidetes/Chlorobi group bacterium ChocPot_Mid]|jgi:hypothetical protein|nr:MAG: hypothetical protein D9V86_03315 [Bacteroidetes/Chlorobi group bacterium ChocPot_Mid]